MKILFFLVVIANVAFLMWEYKTGALTPATEITEQNADSDQEQILLVSELKNIPQPITPALVSETPPAENASNDVSGKSASVPESLPAISEPPLAENAVADNTGKPSPETEPLPAMSQGIEKPALEKAAATDSTISNAGKIAERCYEVGPFADQNAYRPWVNRLKDIKSEIISINRDDQIPSNYMVYYPASETESKANIKMLKDHGITDLWLLTTGEDKGKISLGLFIKEESALTMKNQLLAKGINAEVTAKYKTKSQKYALVKGDDKLMQRLDDLKKSYPQLAVKQVPDLTPGCVGK